jgi:hypothetical protein
MQKHIDQALHNENFHKCIEDHFIDQFNDWKITALFYCAVHYLQSLAAKRRISIGETHHDIESNVNPDRNSASMRISRNAWREYKNLYRYSCTARYNGITDHSTFETLKKVDHGFCLQHLDKFKKYIKGQGVPISPN